MHIKFNNQNKLHNLADFIPSNQLIRFIFLASPKLASLLFPTMAIMALTKSDYEHFSVVVSLAFAASTFSGDSLTLIISKYSIAVREYPKVFINFFVIIFLTTVVLLILGCYIFANNHFYNIKVLISIIALISINLLIPSTFNYIFYQNKVKKLFFILPFIVILSFTSAYIVGMNFGYLELIMVYSSTFLIGTLYLIGEYLKATEKIKNVKSDLSKISLRVLAYSYIPIAFAASLGGPIHGLNLMLLGIFSKTGISEIAIFNTYYPFAMIVAFVPSAFSSLIVRKLSLNNSSNILDAFKSMKKPLVLIMMLMITFLLICSGYIYDFYVGRLGAHDNLLPYMLIIGILLGLLSMTTSALISVGKTSVLIMPAIVNAIMYLLGTVIAVKFLELGALGVCFSLTLSLSTMVIYHYSFLKKAV